MNTHRITWTTNVGDIHKDCTTDNVLNFAQSIISLGFTPTISLLDNMLDN